MVAHVSTVAFQGVDVVEVDVQVQMGPGLPAFTIVGLPDKAVGEYRERVRAALNALGLALPPKRITVNLAPADLAKEGSHFDLPIAVAVLMAMDVLPNDAFDAHTILGELALDGAITRVAGVLPAAIGTMMLMTSFRSRDDAASAISASPAPAPESAPGAELSTAFKMKGTVNTPSTFVVTVSMRASAPFPAALVTSVTPLVSVVGTHAKSARP